MSATRRIEGRRKDPKMKEEIVIGLKELQLVVVCPNEDCSAEIGVSLKNLLE